MPLPPLVSARHTCPNFWWHGLHSGIAYSSSDLIPMPLPISAQLAWHGSDGGGAWHSTQGRDLRRSRRFIGISTHLAFQEYVLTAPTPSLHQPCERLWACVFGCVGIKCLPATPSRCGCIWCGSGASQSAWLWCRSDEQPWLLVWFSWFFLDFINLNINQPALDRLANLDP